MGNKNPSSEDLTAYSRQPEVLGPHLDEDRRFFTPFPQVVDPTNPPKKDQRLVDALLGHQHGRLSP